MFTDIKGNFSSPRYPSIYPNNINCHWTVQQPQGYRIKVRLLDFELEDRDSLTDACDYDFLAIFDGDSETDTLLGKWCGRSSPPSLLSNGNRFLFVLSADRNTASRGFHVSYSGGEFRIHRGRKPLVVWYWVSCDWKIYLTMKGSEMLKWQFQIRQLFQIFRSSDDVDQLVACHFSFTDLWLYFSL